MDYIPKQDYEVLVEQIKVLREENEALLMRP